MTIHLGKVRISFLIRQSLRYNAGHDPPMLVRLLSSERKATQLTGVLVTARISDSAFGTSAAFAVSLVGEPAVRLLTTGGPIIGTFLNEAYEQETIQVESGDILVMYTDGVTEARNPSGVEFGEEKLRSMLVDSWRLTARETAEEVIANVLEWQGSAPQHDDITLVVVKVK